MKPRQDAKYVVLVAGGTGGHVIPAWAAAEALAGMPLSCVLITDPRGDAFMRGLASVGPVEVLPALAPLAGWTSMIPWLWGLGRQFARSIVLLKRYRPYVVVGFGGYPSLAAGLAAFILRIPLWIHEQNAVLGRTNRLLSVIARRILLTFPHTKHVMFASRAFVLGTPIRQEVCRLKAQPLSHTQFTLMILGGSQGAQIFGAVIPQALALLEPSHRVKIHVIQQCRPDQVTFLQTTYQTLAISHQIAPFFSDVTRLMSQAHALISRAGASTLSEWMAFKKPALFVPYPAAMDDHQSANASWVSVHDTSGQTHMMLEPNITPQALVSVIQGWIASWEQNPAYVPPPCSSPLMELEQTHTLWRQWMKDVTVL